MAQTRSEVLQGMPIFGGLVLAAVLNRRRPDIHKRLMWLTIPAVLIGAPVVHAIGHYNLPIFVAPLANLSMLAANPLHDRIAHGRVQGVNYRESLRLQAQRLGVTGWVRNRTDGTVEAMVHGRPDDVAHILDWCRRGPPGAHVTSLEVTEAAGDFVSFERRPSV